MTATVRASREANHQLTFALDQSLGADQAAWAERNFCAEPALLKHCILRSRRRVD
jgi:hypothetical protein